MRLNLQSQKFQKVMQNVFLNLNNLSFLFVNLDSGIYYAEASNPL